MWNDNLFATQRWHSAWQKDLKAKSPLQRAASPSSTAFLSKLCCMEIEFCLCQCVPIIPPSRSNYEFLRSKIIQIQLGSRFNLQWFLLVPRRHHNFRLRCAACESAGAFRHQLQSAGAEVAHQKVSVWWLRVCSNLIKIIIVAASTISTSRTRRNVTCFITVALAVLLCNLAELGQSSR